MSGRKSVNGVRTKKLTDSEYRKLYRQRSTEDTVKTAIDLDKLDTEFYQKVIRTMKGNPKTRRLITFFWFMGFMGGIVNFTAQIAVTSILNNTFLVTL